MPNLSNFSDADLQRLIALKEAGGLQKPPSDYSDDELRTLLTRMPPLAAPASDDVLEEQHPLVSLGERLIVKNLASTPEAAAAYLKKEHPDLETRVAEDGEVHVRKTGEPWRKVDPKGFDWADLGDIGYDVLSGIGSGLATAAGGVAGGLPGAIGAGALAGGGLEAVRQGLGSAAGIPENLSGSGLAMGTAAGAASPLLFGSGASAAALKAAGRNVAAQGGVIPAALKMGAKATGFGASKVGQFLSGVPSERLRNAAARLPAVRQLEEEGVTGLTQETHEAIKGGLRDLAQDAGAKIGGAIDSAQVGIDSAPVVAKFDDMIERLAKVVEDSPTEMNKAKLSNLRATRRELFGDPDAAIEVSSGLDPLVFGSGAGPVAASQRAAVAPKLTGRAAFALQQDLAEAADYLGYKSPGLRSSLEGMSQSDRNVVNAARDAHTALTDAIERAIPNVKGLRQEYKEVKTLQRELNKHFGTPEATYRTIRNLGGKSKQLLSEKVEKLDNRLGTRIGVDAATGQPRELPSLAQQVKLADAYDLLGKASTDALSFGGTTSTSRTITAATLGGGLGGYLGSQGEIPGGPWVGMALGGAAGAKAASPAAMRALMTAWRGAGRAAEAGRSALPYAGLPATRDAFDYVSTPRRTP